MAKKSLGMVFIQLAIALFLLVSGILTVQLDGGILSQVKSAFAQNEIASAVYEIFGRGDFSGIIIVVLGICEIIGGAFLLISFFVNVGKTANLFIFIIMCVWIAVIVLVDILGNFGIINGNVFASLGAFLAYLRQVSSHLLVLGGLMLVQKS